MSQKFDPIKFNGHIKKCKEIFIDFDTRFDGLKRWSMTDGDFILRGMLLRAKEHVIFATEELFNQVKVSEKSLNLVSDLELEIASRTDSLKPTKR